MKAAYSEAHSKDTQGRSATDMLDFLNIPTPHGDAVVARYGDEWKAMRAYEDFARATVESIQNPEPR